MRNLIVAMRLSLCISIVFTYISTEAWAENRKRSIQEASVLKIKTEDVGLDVRSFGAKGDGSTDDTTSIQAALDTGKSIYIPKGHTFIVSTSSTSDGAQCITIKTAGQKIHGGGTIKRKTNTNAHLLRISAPDVVVEGITFDGSRGGSGIKNDPNSNSAVRSFGTMRGVIRNCKFINTPSKHIDLDGVSGWKLLSNFFKGGYRSAIQISSSGSKPCNNNIIAFNQINGTDDGQYANGIFLSASSNSTSKPGVYCDRNVIAFNIVENAGDAGIESGYHCRWTTIMGNTVKNSYNANILVRDNQYTNIIGNTIWGRTNGTGNQQHGIFVDGRQIDGDSSPILDGYITIAENTIHQQSKSGISVIASNYAKIHRNELYGMNIVNGGSGINVKSNYAYIHGNTVKNWQFGIRFSIQGNKPLRSLEGVKCTDNTIDVASNAIYYDGKDMQLDFINGYVTNNMINNSGSKPIHMYRANIKSQKSINNFTVNDTSPFGNFNWTLSISDRDFKFNPNNSAVSSAPVLRKALPGVIGISSSSGTIALFDVDSKGIVTANEVTNISAINGKMSFSLENDSTYRGISLKQYIPAKDQSIYKVLVSSW